MWRFKLDAIITENVPVIIVVESMTECYLKLYFRVITAIQCMLYSHVTVANVTQPEAVLGIAKMFEICYPEYQLLP